MREYFQNLFLSYLYQVPEASRLFFKGGTALRMLYRSPRFSEDLDFSSDLKPFHVKALLTRTRERLAAEGLRVIVLEDKATSGGYLALYRTQVHDTGVGLELNISLRKKAAGQPVLVSHALVPPYQCMALEANQMVEEKLSALSARRKPRDIFDLYFLLRSRLGVDIIRRRRKEILTALTGAEPKALQRDLKPFLPASHQRLLRDLPGLVRKELSP